MVRRKQHTPAIDDEILVVTIAELKYTLDWLDRAYDATKNKTLTFLAAGFALLTFLYASGNLFWPTEFYGQVFYVAGLILFFSAIAAMFVSLWPRTWEFVIESADLDDMNFDDTNHYLQYVKDNHLKAYRANRITYAKNHKLLHMAFFPLVIGAIILVVLKIFGTS